MPQIKLVFCSRHTGWLYVLGMCFLLAGCGGGGTSNVPDSSATVACAAPTPVPGSTGPLIKIMPLGDSITAGTSYRLDLWNHFIQDHVNAQFVGSQCAPPSAIGSRQNEGHPGYRIEDISANVDRWIAAAPSNYILLMIGTNNRIDTDFFSTGPGKLSALIDKIVKDAPNTTVLVASIPPLADTAQEQNAERYNAAIPTIVQTKQQSGKKVYFVDVHSALTTADLVDGIHPNATGYQKIGDAWYKVLKPLLP